MVVVYDGHSRLQCAALQDCDEASTLSRAQRARIGVHLNRREPTKNDYSNFALYQANQKAYEATFMKHFVAHALQPDHIRQCLEDYDGSHTKLETYITTVIANISHIANKLTWNAHHRVVNLLANDDRHGAPFLDTRSFDERIFSDFCPDNTIPVARKLNESWHRAHVQPAMVRFTTRDYPVGQHSSPLEEIDDLASTLFKNEAFAEALPTGRAVKLPTTKKATGRNLPGAAVRDDRSSTSRNWLFVPPTAHAIPSPLTLKHGKDELVKSMTDCGVEGPRLLEDLREMVQYEETPSEPLEDSRSAPYSPSSGSTQLEQLFERYGSNALDSDHVHSSRNVPCTASLSEGLPWPNRLLKDHHRRVEARRGNKQAQSWPLSGIRQVIGQALATGFRPTTDDFEEQVKYIAAREHQQVIRSLQKRALRVPQEPDVMPQNAMGTQPYQAVHDTTEGARKIGTQHSQPPKKRQKLHSAKSHEKAPRETGGSKRREKIKAKSPKQSTIPLLQIMAQEASRPHPSGSTTLALHQVLPPNAYFEPNTPDEQLAWRCGIQHALGNYYNAGNRSSCPGCFVNINHMKMTRMDFYLPASTHFFQPAPDKLWTPSKARHEGERRSKNLSHNSIAKDAYWAAIQAGETVEQARKMCVDAVQEHLRPAPPKEPTQAPTKERTPSPELDLGPHSSGSTTMEHGQNIPESAYFEKQERHEEFAWRCDLNHALGRYYIAGNKSGCPGCGSYCGGVSKYTIMDFYLPTGEVVRQEAPGQYLLLQNDIKTHTNSCRRPGEMEPSQAQQETQAQPQHQIEKIRHTYAQPTVLCKVF